MDLAQLLEAAPPALKLHFAATEPDEPIPLYDGLATLVQRDLRFSAMSRVSVRWRGGPQVLVELKLPEGGEGIDLGRIAELELPHYRQLGGRLLITHLGGLFSGLATARLIPSGRVCFTRGPERATRLRFALAAFPLILGSPVRFGQNRVAAARLEAAYHDWSLTLDQTPSASERSGRSVDDHDFAITHVGEVRCERGFAEADEERIVEILHLCFSFVRGAWAAPILNVAESEDGTVLRKTWASWKSDRARSVSSWLSRFDKEALGQLLPGFARRYEEPSSRDALNRAVHWYVAANANRGTLEEGIIFAHAALEVLSVAIPVSRGLSVSGGNFADKLRSLLGTVGLPSDIPNGLAALVSLAATRGAMDGPQVIKKLRNDVVHPENKLAASAPAMFEGLQLALHWVELVLLWWCGYEGLFVDRGKPPRHEGPGEPVPWARKGG